jgi:hypothetical protein
VDRLRLAAAPLAFAALAAVGCGNENATNLPKPIQAQRYVNAVAGYDIWVGKPKRLEKSQALVTDDAPSSTPGPLLGVPRLVARAKKLDGRYVSVSGTVVANEHAEAPGVDVRRELQLKDPASAALAYCATADEPDAPVKSEARATGLVVAYGRVRTDSGRSAPAVYMRCFDVKRL